MLDLFYICIRAAECYYRKSGITEQFNCSTKQFKSKLLIAKFKWTLIAQESSYAHFSTLRDNYFISSTLLPSFPISALSSPSADGLTSSFIKKIDAFKWEFPYLTTRLTILSAPKFLFRLVTQRSVLPHIKGQSLHFYIRLLSFIQGLHSFSYSHLSCITSFSSSGSFSSAHAPTLLPTNFKSAP